MSKKKKKKNKNKKVLNGIDLVNNKEELEIKKIYEKENIISKSDNDIKKDSSINDKIQSFISILFTIIIFLALILLIIVLYNNYLKKEEVKCDVNKVCQDYIKKDYKIKEDDVVKFIKLNRGIFYSFDNLDAKNIKSEELTNFIVYYLLSLDTDYLECDQDDSRCLISKKEISYNELKEILKKYLNIDNFQVAYTYEFNDTDTIRLYQDGDKIVLSVGEIMLQTYKHDFVDVLIDEDNIRVIMALSKKIDDSNYSYLGYKTINLKYFHNNFVINSIETHFN